jgi:hypothetical protein
MSVANRCLSPTDSSEEPIYLTIRYNITRSDVGTIPRAVIELKQHKSCIKKIQSVPFQYRCLQRRSTSIAGVEDQRVLVGVAQQADGARRAADGGVVLTGQGRRRTSRLPVWRMTSVVWDTHPALSPRGYCHQHGQRAGKGDYQLRGRHSLLALRRSTQPPSTLHQPFQRLSSIYDPA